MFNCSYFDKSILNVYSPMSPKMFLGPAVGQRWPNSTHANGVQPNSTHPNGDHPNSDHPNSVHPNGAYPDSTHSISAQPNSAYPNGAHPNGAQINKFCTETMFVRLKLKALELATFLVKAF